MQLRVFNIIKNTKVEGPGNRYCIWVQGCSRHCKGCQAVHTWSHKGGELYYVKDIIEDIFKVANIISPHPNPPPRGGNYVYPKNENNASCKELTHQENFSIEGVTFLGGEPFEQAEALGVIAEKIKKAGLSVVCFTGCKFEDLKLEAKNKKLLDNIDLLIDGEYIEELKDFSRPWCGSSNQRYHFLTDPSHTGRRICLSSWISRLSF